MEVIDLDVIVPEPKSVRLGGRDYRVPGDMPMEIFLRLNQAEGYATEDGLPDISRQLESLIETISDLLTYEQRELIDPDTLATVKETVSKVIKGRGMKYTFQLIRSIYRPDDKAAEEKAAEAPLDPAPQD